MAIIDYYKVLGITKAATAKDIKNAYRKLARKYHPDLNPDNKEAKSNFQKINEANEVLSDPVKRKKYDQYGKDWDHADDFEKAKKQQSSGFAGGGFSDFQSDGGYSDFFESMFGGRAGAGRGRQQKFRGEDYSSEIQLNLLDAYTTHKQTLTVNGKNIRITIPAGIDNGQTIKIPGHGAAGTNGGPNGDLYITFTVLNHPKIKRLENNLYITEPLNLFTAVLGGDITIETLSGKVKLKVKSGTQNGSMVKLKGKGFPVYKREGDFGDLLVTYTVKIPEQISAKQREMYEELSKM